MSMSNKEVIKDCKLAAKKVGLTFKRSDTKEVLYDFVDRKTQERVLCCISLSVAYDNVCSGYIESYDKDCLKFRGV